MDKKNRVYYAIDIVDGYTETFVGMIKNIPSVKCTFQPNVPHLVIGVAKDRENELLDKYETFIEENKYKRYLFDNKMNLNKKENKEGIRDYFCRYALYLSSNNLRKIDLDKEIKTAFVVSIKDDNDNFSYLGNEKFRFSVVKDAKKAKIFPTYKSVMKFLNDVENQFVIVKETFEKSLATKDEKLLQESAFYASELVNGGEFSRILLRDTIYEIPFEINFEVVKVLDRFKI